MADDFELTGEWPAAPPRKDPQQVAAAAHREKTLHVMQRRHGPPPEGVVCGGCRFLVRSGGGDGYFPKCTAFRVSCSKATDWRVRWPGCGKYVERERTET